MGHGAGWRRASTPCVVCVKGSTNVRIQRRPPARTDAERRRGCTEDRDACAMHLKGLWGKAEGVPVLSTAMVAATSAGVQLRGESREAQRLQLSSEG